MGESLGIAALSLAFLGVVWWWWEVRVRARSRERLSAELDPPAPQPEALPERRVVFPRRRSIAVAAALAAGLGAYWLLSLGLIFPPAIAAMTLLLGLQAESWFYERRQAIAEGQLSDAIDLMIGTLQAGGGLMNALESVIRETRPPLRAEFEEVQGRIRLGDEPLAVLNRVADRVPLESVRLFATTLAVHWEVGGSLAPTLASVGKTIRDRIEISRRVRSMTAQGRLSILSVLGTTYFIGAVIWSSDPDRMERFLLTQIGQVVVAAAMLLQTVGIVWANRLMKLRF